MSSGSRRLLLPTEDPFYRAQSGFQLASPGTVLRSRRVELALLGVVRQRVTAWQLLYRSSDLDRAPEVAVTTVLVPDGSAPGRPLLAYQCAIDAVSQRCCPSYALRRGARAVGSVPQAEWPVIANALRRGWVVTISDHGGLQGRFGAPREPGYRVLDAIRATLQFAPAGLAGDAPVAAWGYSGGGMATSWAAELAPRYAPEIDLVGAVLGSPVGDPGRVFVRLNGTFYAGLPMLVLSAIRHVYPELDRLVRAHSDAAGIARLDDIETRTTTGAVLRYRYNDFADYIDRPLPDLLATPEVTGVFADLRLGDRTPGCPLLVVQSVHDQIIAVDNVDAQVQRYRDAGAHVRYLRDRLSEHLSAMWLSAPLAFDWIADRFAGRPPAPAETRTVVSSALSVTAVRGYAGMTGTLVRVLFGRPLGRPRRSVLPRCSVFSGRSVFTQRFGVPAADRDREQPIGA